MEELSFHGIVFSNDRKNYFDTVSIDIKKSGLSSSDKVLSEFHKHGINLRKIDNNHISISFDEITTLYDLNELIDIFVAIKKDDGLFENKGNESKFGLYENRVYDPINDELKRKEIPLAA